MSKKTKRSFSLPVFIFLVLFSILLVFLNVDIWQERVEKRRHLSSMREALQMPVETVFDLEDEDEIERIAREQLLMIKEGEEVVVISRKEEETEEVEEEEEPGFFEQLMEILRR